MDFYGYFTRSKCNSHKSMKQYISFCDASVNCICVSFLIQPCQKTKQPSHQSNFFIIIIKLNTNQPFVCCGPTFFRSKQLNVFAIFISMMIACVSFPTKMATFLNICGLTLNFGQIRRLQIGPIKEQFLSVSISHL